MGHSSSTRHSLYDDGASHSVMAFRESSSQPLPPIFEHVTLHADDRVHVPTTMTLHTMPTLALVPSLPCAPFARIRELLRRLALMSAIIAVFALFAVPIGATAKIAAAVVLGALLVQWTLTRIHKEWSRTEQVLEGVLLFALAALAGPAIGTPAFYGGLNYRALGRGSRAAFEAAAIYLVAFLLASLLRHPRADMALLGTLGIALPGFPFCALMLHALSRALQAQEHAEARLRTSETHLRSLVDEAPIAIIALSNDDLVTMWNPCAERMLGWSTAEVIGRPLPTIPPERRAEFEVARAEERRGGQIHHGERVILRKDGSPIHVSLSTAPLHNPAREVHGTIVLYSDISERIALEEQLRQSQKMEAVGQLAGGVAHDFNNLLTVIMAHTSLLAQTLTSDAESLEGVAEIQKAALGAAKLTRQLLAFSRKQVLKSVVLDLNETIVGFAGMLRRVLAEDIEIVTRHGDEPLFVRADPGQLEQVVMNLAVNARDAMPFGGTLTIETGLVNGGRESVVSGDGVLPSGFYGQLTVSDTGVGIPPEVQARIFDPFFTTKGVGRGTGLGLSTVFGIVTQSEGHLALSSTPGVGTRFRIFFPIQPFTEFDDRTSAHADFAAATGSETILLVEDSAPVRALARRVLERQGYIVIEASDGVEGTEASENYSERIDLVLTDAIMPRMGGGELVRTIREFRPGIRVLYMTGYTDNELVRAGLKNDHDSLIHKPFTPDALMAAVRQTLDMPERVAV
jgi:PAS domain S-box-containing protein